MGLTKQAAMEGATRNIRVNAVLPGMTMTELIAWKRHFERCRAFCERNGAALT